MGAVRVAIVGVGNCATSLVQGVEYYKDADPDSRVPGLMHVQFGDYHVGDVEFVAAFDVDAKKVGLDLSDAIGASENNTIKICDVPNKGVTVQRGHTLDGLGKYYRETIEESAEAPVDIVQILKDKQVDVLVCYLPVGSEDAAKFYAQAAIDAKVAFVNALPVFIAGTKEWADKFTEAGVPIVGDDIKSQVGATITHRVMAKLFEDRGVRLERTMQLNVGGNMDFKNMLERERLESKKISKTQAVTSQIPDRDMGAKNVHIGPSDYVAWLDDRKWAFIRLEGRNFGDVPNKGITVQRGHTLDGLGKYYRMTIEESAEAPVDIVQILKDKQVDVLVCYLPVGSEDAAKFYAQCAIDAKVAFVNALPVFIAGTKEWADKFTEAGVPIVGDDIKSQVGATITHRVMAKLFEDRGVRLERTMQLNVGGNMDFKNMLERERLESKKISKTQAVTSQIPDRDLGAKNVHIGPSDYVQWLDDRKWAYVRLEGRAFGDVPLNLEYKLEVWDSPNSAGVIIDALRAAKIAKDRGIGGPILSASSYFMKSPPVQFFDDQARENVEKFIAGEVER